MSIYLIYMISPFILEMLFRFFYPHESFENAKMRHRYVLACGLVMFLMIALRSYHNGSGDSRVYYDLWGNFRSMSLGAVLDVDMEKGFLFSVWGLSRVFQAKQWVFIFSAAVFALSITNFVEKNCDDICIAFMVFNCLGMFNFFVQGMRQSLAIAICLFALEFCKKRKLVPFLIMVFIAMLFHGSAIVFCVIYPIWGMKVDARHMLLMAAASAVVFLSLGKIFELVNFVINDHYAIDNTELTNGGGFTMAIYIVCILVGMFLAWQCKTNEQDFVGVSFFVYITIISAISFSMRYYVTTIMERVSFYFAFGEMAIIARAPRLIVKEQRRIARLAIIALCFMVAFYKATYSDLVPYRFFWSN